MQPAMTNGSRGRNRLLNKISVVLSFPRYKHHCDHNHWHTEEDPQDFEQPGAAGASGDHSPNMRIRRKPHRPNDSLARTSHLTKVFLFVIVFVFYAISRYYQLLRRDRLSDRSSSTNHHNLRKGVTADKRDNLPLFNQDRAAEKATHLIVVAGHSITTNSGHLQDANRDEQDWYLLPYQKRKGLPAAMVKHIQAGLDAAARDETSLLVFSGGQTRAAMGPESEGASYFRVVEVMELWPETTEEAAHPASSVRSRTTTEEYATDSFTNLLYSICRFKEVTGQYPSKITVVSFTFKQKRFETLHAPALHWPGSRFEYIGVDPSSDTGFDLEEATRGELEQAAKPFETDPYGCHSPILQKKRQERNPFARTPPYELSCPDMKDILRYCGLDIISRDLVPWKF